MNLRRWTAAVALVAAVLVAGPYPTSDGPREGPDVTLEPVEVPAPERPSVVRDSRAVVWMICRSDAAPTHRRCREVGR